MRLLRKKEINSFDEFIYFMNKSLLKHCIETLDWSILSLSKKHCHTKNVHSIVLDKTNGLTRAFIALPGSLSLSRDMLNTGNFVVGVHNHKYNLLLQLIEGNVFNVRFGTMNFKHVNPILCKHYSFSSVINGGKPTLLNEAHIYLDSIETLSEDFPIRMYYNDLHTIYSNNKSIWLVKEFAVQQETTDLYTNSDLNFDGLYENFESREEILSLL